MAEKRTKEQGPKLAVWDLTIPTSSGLEDLTHVGLVKTALQEWAKKWVFQEEISTEKKYQHFQIRMSLHKREREGSLAYKLKETALKGHLSATSTKASASFDYVMKADTRTRGPWKDTDEKVGKVPNDVARMKTLWPFQEKLRKECLGEADYRKIIVIVGLDGNNGKTGFRRWMQWHTKAQYVPPIFGDMTKLLGFVCSFPPNKVYIVDLPRGIKQNKKSKVEDIWAGLEVIKGGDMYDWRHKGKAEMMSIPHIIVLTNEIPDRSLLSPDRWDIRYLCNTTKDFILEPVGGCAPIPLLSNLSDL